MSDLTDAIEALRKVFDSQKGSYMYTKGYIDESDFELMLSTAEPIIRADERAKVAEEIARAIDATGILGNWQAATKIAQDVRTRAAAIARQHAGNGPSIAVDRRSGAHTSNATTGTANAAEDATAGFGTTKLDNRQEHP